MAPESKLTRSNADLDDYQMWKGCQRWKPRFTLRTLTILLEPYVTLCSDNNLSSLRDDTTILERGMLSRGRS